MKRKYKLISEDLQKSLIEFLDEVQFEAAKNNTNDDMHVVNFCSYAINELLNGYDAYFKDKKPNKKSRDDYVEETFMDWNLPEMDDDEYEKLVDQFDAFLRGWEKEYYKKNKSKPTKKSKPKSEKNQNFKPHIDDVIEYCSLDEIKDMLIDDPELSNQERFELYYDERERRKPENKGLTYEELLKGANLKPPTKK